MSTKRRDCDSFPQNTEWATVPALQCVTVKCRWIKYGWAGKITLCVDGAKYGCLAVEIETEDEDERRKRISRNEREHESQKMRCDPEVSKRV